MGDINFKGFDKESAKKEITKYDPFEVACSIFVETVIRDEEAYGDDINKLNDLYNKRLKEFYIMLMEIGFIRATTVKTLDDYPKLKEKHD